MIISVVRDANLNGKGLTQLEVIDGIRRKWWPDAPDNRIRPMFWSLWKQKSVLVRKRDKYFLANMNEKEAPTRELEGAS